MSAGIYIHIPFCLAKCIYCDFYSVTVSADGKSRFEDNLLREISLRAKAGWQQYIFDTIYFGGGTPSILSPDRIGIIIESLRNNFKIESDCEITVEANPETVNVNYFEKLKQIGVNRISIGIQSFDDSELKTLGRIHSAQTGINAIGAARLARFENFSIDLIFGIPGQSRESWRRTLAIAIEQNPAHISAYGLTIENGTPLNSLVQSGQLTEMDENLQLEMYKTLLETLSDNGYVRYEISNFAKSGLKSRHNLKYWQDNIYLGLGPSAHSYDGYTRAANTRNLSQYNSMVKNNLIPIEFKELLSPEQKMTERLLMEIRLADGVTLADVISVVEQNSLKMLSEEGLVRINDGKLLITEKGLPVSDKIIALLLKL